MTTFAPAVRWFLLTVTMRCGIITQMPLTTTTRNAPASRPKLIFRMRGLSSSSDPMPLSRFFTELFSRATSWLHWPPSEVWNTSVAEIVTALEAQAERELRLAGIPSDNGKGPEVYTPERLREIEADGIDPAVDRAALQALKARHQ
ncbi:hypothetical protein HOY34_16830 [Xinfangfangia sp. D13-10-4-6]|uniref:hypothetical protein n=1 Tax=Pseudogemmobacter hezensis TaxID=2737662 RepID=UPI001553FB31|nr:hypothetical protein [Pseudogemmobacter hezensis]NPD16860.1 hypothetical protein [Pseudogemmobacter hezensis]